MFLSSTVVTGATDGIGKAYAFEVRLFLVLFNKGMFASYNINPFMPAHIMI